MGLKRPAEDVETIDVQEDAQAVQVPAVQLPAPKPRPDKEKALRWRFSPAAEAIDDSCCFARVQIDGVVRQCDQKRHKDRVPQEWFCTQHSGNRWQILGRVDGDIPKAQLAHVLQKAAEPRESQSYPQAIPKGGRKVLPKTGLKALGSKELSDVTHETFGNPAQESEKLQTAPSDEVIDSVLKQLEDDLWHEVQRVKQLDDSQDDEHRKLS
ncbi:unnamed protein product [Symbiodinium sp. CCMP2456]|nr:unnamed protein product [Symbiodinium sp. CCMP2456]